MSENDPIILHGKQELRFIIGAQAARISGRETIHHCRAPVLHRTRCGRRIAAAPTPAQRTSGHKHGPQAIGPSRGGWTTKSQMVAAEARTAITFALSPGQAHDAPEGRTLRQRFGRVPRPISRLMDRAYEGNATRQLAVD